MKDKKENLEPIQQSMHVDCPFEDAFRLFTEGFGKWWPLAPGSGPGADPPTCEIEPWVGGRVLERSGSGVEREWGSVTAWDPPGNLEFTWQPGGPKDERQTVSVEFQKEADGTRVTLTHRGWQFAGVAVCVSGATGSAIKVIHGLAISWAPNWRPVAIGREIGDSGVPADPVGFGTREQAWRNAARPAWAEVFLNSFAAFVAEHMLAAV
ncbi:MAG TPA: SRPBCC domain-containing protein [Bryobacteraceae bacterium]|nr:SRPBCC domain-containing protein [Bryobacteraceae bacterium]